MTVSLTRLSVAFALHDSVLKQRRRGSKDAAGDEKSEWERRLDKPSVPLKVRGKIRLQLRMSG